MLTHRPQELDELGVAGIEADAHAGQVRAFGEGVDRDHAVAPALQDRTRRPVPGELGIALVGEHGDRVGPAPGRLRVEVPEATGRVGGRIRPQQQGTRRVGGADGAEIEPADPPRLGRHRHGAAAGQLRAHGVGRIRHGRVQHRVLVRLAQPEDVGHRGDELLRPHTGGNRGRRELGHAEAAGQPLRRRLAQLAGSPPRRGNPARCPTTRAPRPRRAAGGRRASRWSSRPCRLRARRRARPARPGGRRGTGEAEARRRRRHELGEASPAHIVQHHLKGGRLLPVALAHHLALSVHRRQHVAPRPGDDQLARHDPTRAGGRRPPAGGRRRLLRCGRRRAPTLRWRAPTPWRTRERCRPCSRPQARAPRPPRSRAAPRAPHPSGPRR